jgi:hypothetical protein
VDGGHESNDLKAHQIEPPEKWPERAEAENTAELHNLPQIVERAIWIFDVLDNKIERPRQSNKRTLFVVWRSGFRSRHRVMLMDVSSEISSTKLNAVSHHSNFKGRD